MASGAIGRRVDVIEREMERLTQELNDIRGMCPHPEFDIRYRYGSDTGNWDRGQDSYWTEMHCLTCGKRWTAEGSLNLPHAKEVKRGEVL